MIQYGDVLVGDVNLFIETIQEDHHNLEFKMCELDVMIAEPSFREKGIASKAIKLAIEYARDHLSINDFEVKILQSNEPNIRLFKKLGFQLYRSQ